MPRVEDLLGGVVGERDDERVRGERVDEVSDEEMVLELMSAAEEETWLASRGLGLRPRAAVASSRP